MKTIALLQRCLIVACGSVILPGFLCAQGHGMGPPGEGNIIISERLVEADYSTAASKKTAEPFLRTVLLTPLGEHRIVVTDADGTVRMRGSMNADGNVANGNFEYFHANGRKESEGHFTNGMKDGKWACWTSEGNARADRFYHGMTWDQLQVLVGVAEHAPTVGESAVASVLPAYR